MKTLFICYCADSRVGRICAENAASRYTDVVELAPRYSCSFARRLSCALSGQGVRIKDLKIDFSKYDSIIIASTLTAGMPSAVVNEFLHTTNFNGAEVIGVFIKDRLFSRHTFDIFRKRISLAGGSCRSVVTIPAKEIKKNPGHIMDFVKNALIKAGAF